MEQKFDSDEWTQKVRPTEVVANVTAKIFSELDKFEEGMKEFKKAAVDFGMNYSPDNIVPGKEAEAEKLYNDYIDMIVFMFENAAKSISKAREGYASDEHIASLEEYRKNGGKLTVDAKKMRRTLDKVHRAVSQVNSLYLFPYGQIIAFVNGEQHECLQEKFWTEMIAARIEECGFDPTTFEVMLPLGGARRRFVKQMKSDGVEHWDLEIGDDGNTL